MGQYSFRSRVGASGVLRVGGWEQFVSEKLDTEEARDVASNVLV